MRKTIPLIFGSAVAFLWEHAIHIYLFFHAGACMTSWYPGFSYKKGEEHAKPLYPSW